MFQRLCLTPISLRTLIQRHCLVVPRDCNVVFHSSRSFCDSKVDTFYELKTPLEQQHLNKQEPDLESDVFGQLKAPLERSQKKGSYNLERPTVVQKITLSSSESNDRKWKSGVFSQQKSTPGKNLTKQRWPVRENETEKSKWQKDVLKYKPTSTVSVPKLEDRKFPKNNVNADKFGDIAGSDTKYRIETIAESLPDDNDPEPSETFKPTDLKRKRFLDYSFDMRNLIREGKTKEAIEVFESLTDLRIPIENAPYLYTIIISGCGKRGYTEKAFELFRRMREHGLKPTPAVLTGLFNSCAECPFPEIGLGKAKHLHKRMLEEGWQPNQRVYHAMIKAYGRCGDIASAFLLVDKMKNDKFPITDETFAFLLQTCISNREVGFTHAITVMRKMRTMKIKPTVFSYNLLLRAVRDCGVGPPEVAAKLLLEWNHIKESKLNNRDTKFLPGVDNPPPEAHPCAVSSESPIEIPSAALEEPDFLIPLNPIKKEVMLKEVLFDLLSPQPPQLNIVALGEIKRAEDRLALVGGTARIFNKLSSLCLKPNIKTCTLLLECEGPFITCEASLLELMKENGVTPDIDFCNVLIKKRWLRSHYKDARAVLDLIKEYHLDPDIATFGTLAKTCRNRYTSNNFLQDMRKGGFVPNIQVLGALLNTAYRKMDFKWMQDLMKALSEHEVKPCPKFLNQLEEAWQDASHALVRLEKGKTVPAWAENEHFQASYKQFCIGYKNWLKKTEVSLPEHPFDQFKTKVSDKQNN